MSDVYHPIVPRELTTGAQVLDNVRRTRSYFDSLRSPTALLEQRIEALTKRLEGAAEENARLTTTVSELRAKLFLYEDPATDGRVSVKSIQLAVTEHYGLSLTELLSGRRTWAVVGPRQIAMYLAKILTTHSYPEIGRRFGGRDHTTVLHAIRTVSNKCQTNPDIKDVVALIREKVFLTKRPASSE